MGVLQMFIRALTGALLFIGILSFLPGCAFHGAWYRPDAPVGHVENRECTTVSSQWVFKRQGVVFNVGISPATGPYKASIGVNVDVPAGSVVRSLFEKLRAYDASGSELKADFGIYAFFYGVNGEFIKNELPQKTYSIIGSAYSTKRTPHAHYNYGLTMKGELPDSLDVVIPRMEVDGRNYPQLTIHFVRKTGAYYMVC